jgi:hypothetical protein
MMLNVDSIKKMSSNYVVDSGLVMVFNATFNNISAISWQSDLLVEEIGVPVENQVTDILTYLQEKYILSLSCY